MESKNDMFSVFQNVIYCIFYILRLQLFLLFLNVSVTYMKKQKGGRADCAVGEEMTLNAEPGRLLRRAQGARGQRGALTACRLAVTHHPGSAGAAWPDPGNSN